MKRRFGRVRLFTLAAPLLLVAAWGLAGVARGDDRASTAALLDELDRDTAHKQDIAEMVKRARVSMERATRLRSAGDEGHARLADGLAREQAETARDLARAIDAERAADDARRGAIDAGAAGDRERALLEEGIARNGRLRAEIDAVAKPQAETKTSAKGSAPAPATDAPSPAGDGGAPLKGPRGPKAPAAAKDGGAQ
jgi:hypothetical protein